MKKIVLFCVLLTGCVPTDGKSCEFCGKWSFDRFEYTDHITADCKGMAQSYYENTFVEINGSNIVTGGYDKDENAQEILVKKRYRHNRNILYHKLRFNIRLFGRL